MKQTRNSKMAKSLLVAFLIATAVVGCKKTPVVTLPTEPQTVRFSLANKKTPDLQQSASRAVTNDEFLPSSIIGVWASEAAVVDLSTTLNSNVGYGNKTGSLVWSEAVVGDQILFLADDGAMNFYAYHPHSDQAGSSVTANGTTINYTLQGDQSSVESLKVADLMWGRSLNNRQSNGTVKIEFNHSLAKLNLKITKGADWGSTEAYLTGVEISGANLIKTASMSLSDGALTVGSMAAGEQGVVMCNMPEKRRLDALNEIPVHFIVIPCSAQGTKLSFHIGDGSVEYSTIINTNTSYKAATQLNIGIVINKNSPVDIFINPVIEPWNYASQVDIEGI